MKRYIRTLVERIRLIAACVLVTVAAAVIYVNVAPRTYQATSEALVSPVSTTDTTLVSLPVLHSTGDPAQDVLTAASLITTPQVANAAAARLHLHESGSSLLGTVSAAPVGQSNLVAIQATESTAKRATDVANAFAAAVVSTRAAAMQAAANAQIPGLKAQVAALPASQRAGAGTIGDQLLELESLSHSQDPTITIAARATEPTSPASPKTKLTLGAALLAGLIIGIGAAFGWDALDPALQRDQQIREILRLPTLARIPVERARRRNQPILPSELSFGAAEGYRTLRAMMNSRADGSPRVVLVTGSSPAEGKTTSAINLAAAIAQGGSRVVLIEADLRRPTIASSLGLVISKGTEDVLIGEADLEEALAVYRFDGVPVRVLAVRHPGAELADRLSYAIVQRLIDRARAIADFVVIDSPPLTAVMDALPLARVADEVVIVARLGHSRLNRLWEVRQLLAEQGQSATGVLLIGDSASRRGYYYNVDGDSLGRRSAAERELKSVRTPRA